MEIVLVGLPGSGKSVVARRLAHRHRATLIDLDEAIETEAELETLRSLAVAYGQGYLLGRPRDSRDSGPWPMRMNVRKSDGGHD